MTNKEPNIYTFALVLEGISELSADVVDAIYEAGCDDAGLGFRGPIPVLEFDREAASLEDAVTSALADVESADIGAIVLRVEPDDLVNASEIARRVDVTREAVRLWATGERGIGDFPPPVALLYQSTLWSWQEIAAWLVSKGLAEESIISDARFFAALNSCLEAERMFAIRTEVNRLSRKLRDTPVMARLRGLMAHR